MAIEKEIEELGLRMAEESMIKSAMILMDAGMEPEAAAFLLGEDHEPVPGELESCLNVVRNRMSHALHPEQESLRMHLMPSQA